MPFDKHSTIHLQISNNFFATLLCIFFSFVLRIQAMARTLEIAQFDSTDSWEDRTLKKLNLNFRQVQGAFDFLQSSLPSSSSTSSGGKELLWENEDTTVDQGSFEVSLPYTDYDYLAIDFRLGTSSDYWYTQFVPYRSNFVLTQISSGNAVPGGNGICIYSRPCSYDSANNKLVFADVKLARPDNSWIWANNNNALVVGRIYGIKF